MNNGLFSRFIIIGAWWNPWSWGEALGESVSAGLEALNHTMNEMLVDSIEWSLGLINNMFNESINALRSEVVLTPAQFDSGLVNSLEQVTKMAILPVAGILITYMFAYEIYEMFTRNNKGDAFGAGETIMLIIKTTVTIYLATHAFTISLAFSDLSSWIVQQVPDNTVQIRNNLTEEIVKELEPEIVHRSTGKPNDQGLTELSKEDRENFKWDFKLGQAIGTAVISSLSIIGTMLMAGIMYLVAWSRMIMIMLYVSVSPLPMATLMNQTWLGSIGQNYLKNLMALMLQGFMMLVLLIIYSGLMNRVSTLIAGSSDPMYGLMLLLVSMGIVVKMLIQTGSLSKSIMGAS